MKSIPESEAFNAGTTVIQSATDMAAAQELARSADSAALMAKLEERLKEYNQQNMSTITDSMVNVVNDALGRFPTRYFDSSRIPLMCKTIMDFGEDLKDVKQMMKDDREEANRVHERFVTKDGQYFIVRIIVFVGTGTVLLYVLNSFLGKS